jgi:hypothetical protein
MKKIVFLAVSVLVALTAFCGCEKLADGCGTLTVTLRNAKSDVVVSVYPYTTDLKPTSPIEESTVRAGVGTVSFELNAGDYLIYAGSDVARQGAQVRAGQNTEVVFLLQN